VCVCVCVWEGVGGGEKGACLCGACLCVRLCMDVRMCAYTCV
jgi:hypothetical protein